MVELHTHSRYSDGTFTPEEVIMKAIENDLYALAITDHNHLLSEEQFTALQKTFPEITLIQGCEIDCRYETIRGNLIDLHLIALGFNPNTLQPFVSDLKRDRAAYLNEILTQLDALGVHLNTSLEDLQRRYGSANPGRMQLAQFMVDFGYVDSIDEAFDEYFGSYGKRRVICNPLDFSTYKPLKETVEAVYKSGGIPVIAHLLSYKMTGDEILHLLEDFKCICADRPAAMEVFYQQYDNDQKADLKEMADRYHLYYSSASDFHTEKDSLMSIGHLHPDDFDRHVASLLLTHEELDLCKDLQPIKLSRKIASLRKSAQLTEIFDRDDHVVPLSEISVTQLMLSNVDLPSFDIFDSIKWEDEDHE